jgi:hypothetical protein
MVWGAGVIRSRWVQCLPLSVIAAGYLGLTGPAALAQSMLSVDTRIAAPVGAKPAMLKRRSQDPGREAGVEAEEGPPPGPEASDEAAAETDQPQMTADAGPVAAEPTEEDGLLVLDGLVLADGTVPVLTGIASLGVEPRTPEDIAAFELPPVGYDPYMFRIEPEPLRDRRPAERTLRPDRRAPPRSRHFPRGADCGACHQQRAEEPGAAGRCGSRGALRPARRYRLALARPGV